MNKSSLQEVYQICSFLLSYPDEEFTKLLPFVLDEIDTLTISSIKEELLQFCQKAMKLTKNEFINTYIYTFDFGKKTNLYVTYMANGEQRERGMDLLFLKNYYKINGFEMMNTELPDYLPIILEFASQVDTEIITPIFERYFDNIHEIADHLNPEDHLYGHIIKSVMLAIEYSGITQSVRRSEVGCYSSFSG